MDPLLGVTVATVSAALVAASAAHPRAMLVLVIPVALWPEQASIGDYPLTYAMVAVVEAGVFLGCLGRLAEVRKPVFLTLAFSGLMVAAFLSHGPPVGLTATEQRNHFIAFLLGVWLVPTAALARPSLQVVLRVTALSGAAASLYSFLFADRVGGRAAFVDYNSDVLGCAAAVAALTILAVAHLEKNRAWLWLLPAPALAFLAAQTRSALVVLVVGLAFLWVLARPGAGRVIVSLVGIAALPLLVEPALALQRSLFAARDVRYLEVGTRWEALKLAGGLIRDNPLWGVGYRHFPDESVRALGIPLNAHNDYALLAAENGLPAAILFVLLVARVLTFHHPDPRAQAALRAVLVAAFVALAFGNLLTDLRMTMPGWLLLGLAWTLPTKPTEPEVRPREEQRRPVQRTARPR